MLAGQMCNYGATNALINQRVLNVSGSNENFLYFSHIQYLPVTFFLFSIILKKNKELIYFSAKSTEFSNV